MELGIILSIFVSMLFGIINIAMVLWTLGGMHYAAQTAAREYFDNGSHKSGLADARSAGDDKDL